MDRDYSMEAITQFLKKIFLDWQRKKINIDASVFSNPGNVRSNHEDNYLLGYGQYISQEQQRKMINSYITSSCVFKGEQGVFAVCDGMGGHTAGEKASGIAVHRLNDLYDALLISGQEQIERYVSLINHDICAYAKMHSECRNMGSTLAALLIANQKIYCFHVGDSRIYKFSDGMLCRLTDDHTEGQRLLKLKLITEQELDSLGNKKHLYRYLGYSGELIPDVKKIEMAEGYYMICSDGVTDILEDRVLESIFRADGGSVKIAEKILRRALKMNERCMDNITVIVVHITFGRRKA